MSGVAHFFVVVGGSKIHERLAHFFIDIYIKIPCLKFNLIRERMPKQAAQGIPFLIKGESFRGKKLETVALQTSRVKAPDSSETPTL